MPLPARYGPHDYHDCVSLEPLKTVLTCIVRLHNPNVTSFSSDRGVPGEEEIDAAPGVDDAAGPHLLPLQRRGLLCPDSSEQKDIRTLHIHCVASARWLSFLLFSFLSSGYQLGVLL